MCLCPGLLPFGLMDRVDVLVAALRALGKQGAASPEQQVHVLVARLRDLGHRGGDRLLREAARRYRIPPKSKPGRITRAEAAEALGFSVQRIDQLRRQGHLAWERNPHTREVRVIEASVARYRDQIARKGERT